MIDSRSVDWWRVHSFVQPFLIRVGSWPEAGTLAWQALDDDDPIKMAALYDAAQHHVLRVDTAQAALADASRAVSAAVDWRSIASEVLQRSTCRAFIPRRTS